jgi:hypothetical protein
MTIIPPCSTCTSLSVGSTALILNLPLKLLHSLLPSNLPASIPSQLTPTSLVSQINWKPTSLMFALHIKALLYLVHCRVQSSAMVYPHHVSCHLPQTTFSPFLIHTALILDSWS